MLPGGEERVTNAIHRHTKSGGLPFTRRGDDGRQRDPIAGVQRLEHVSRDDLLDWFRVSV